MDSILQLSSPPLIYQRLNCVRPICRWHLHIYVFVKPVLNWAIFLGKPWFAKVREPHDLGLVMNWANFWIAN